MIVGIGAICEGGKTIVMAADRLITVGEANLVTELEHPKLSQVLPNVWVTITGSVQQYEYSLERSEDFSHLLKGSSVHEIARRFQRTCHRIRLRILENRFTWPLLGLRFSEFSERCVNSQANSIISDIYTKMSNHPFDMLMLIAGIDDRGPHLYLVNDLAVNSFQAMGYAAIGIGAQAATVSLARSDHCYYSRSVAETVYRVYEAKRASEQTALVSKTTDMVIIRQSVDPQIITPAQIDVLSRIYDARMKLTLSSEEIDAIGNRLAATTPPPTPKAPARSKRRRRGR